ncbi:MAG: hypothetical protein K2K41_08375 [Ruminiclostridium sp.]|nr:hypothetical protein [Ruminiclostridium sp.]
MIYKILGVERKSGEFDGNKGKTIAYDNIYLHCSKCNDYSSEGSFGIGESVNSRPANKSQVGKRKFHEIFTTKIV